MAEHRGQDGLRLLSLDGGGVRGLSELLILQEIMGRIKFENEQEEEPLPCDYFDLIGGTSTGGIIALMLGRLRMSVSKAIECYGILAEQVFSDVKQPWGDGKFRASKFEEVIKAIVKKETGQANERLMDKRAGVESCRTFVCAMGALNMAARIPRLFRTYQAPKNQTSDCMIWEAARATSAAPVFFKRILIGEPGSSEPYVDGGMGCNNPIAQVLQEAKLMFPDRHVACIISIGTGQAQTISIPKPSLFQRVLPFDVVKAIQGIATDCDQSAQDISHRFQNTPNLYFRLNVEQGLQNVGLSQWERLNEVTAHTKQYMLGAEVDQKLGAAVVAIRDRQGAVATADIGGTVRTSTHQQLRANLKCCPAPTHVFTGRSDILDQMEKYYSENLGKRHVFVLHGLGGAGKSQIAFKFVEGCQFGREPSRFSDVFFVDASTADTISADLKNIARVKGIGESDKDTLEWLARRREEWLLLLNNADDTTINLGNYLPRCSHGNVLITSRNHAAHVHASGAQSHRQVAGMNPNDARKLLLEIAHVGEDDVNETEALATMIVKEVGYLALAVVQAGAYIATTACSLERYHDMYRQRRGALLEEYRDDVQKIGDYKWTAYTTWTISFDRLSTQAATLLQLFAFLHHEGISEAIFQNAAANIGEVSDFPISDQASKALSKAKDFLELFRTSNGPWDGQEFLRMIKEIRSYSLIDVDQANQTYAIHPLVHSWTRTTICDEEDTRATAQWILGMSVNLRDAIEDRTFRRTLLPHADAALKSGTTTGPDVCTRLGHVYHDAGRWKDTELLLLQVEEARKRVLGPEHPSTLTSIANLASTFGDQGRWKEAEELHVKVLEARTRVLGAEHPRTLTSMANLALTFWSQGRWKEAEELHVKVLEARTRVLGAEHPRTLTSMANLALTFGDQGRWKEAEELTVTILEAEMRVLGAEHPRTLISMANLASTFWDQGRWKEAEDLEVKVIEAGTRMFGKEHPITLTSMSNLASTFCDQGRWKEAEELGVGVLEANTRVLGAEHPSTLTSMANLASTFGNQARWKEAEELEVKVLEARTRVLGAEHPSTLNSMVSLASTFWEQGRWKEAEDLEVKVLEARTRVHGAEHPRTLTSMSNLALTFWSQGRWKEAEELHVKVLDARTRVLGAEHPDTLTSMANLASTFRKQGRWKEAEELEVKVLEARTRVLGAAHPDTLRSMSNRRVDIPKSRKA